MANVTVEVIGNAAGGGTGPVQPPQGSGSSVTPGQSGAQSIIPDNARMIEDVRREMQARGVLLVPGSQNVSQIITQYGQNLRTAANERISSQYDEKRQAIRDKYRATYEEIETNLAEQKRQKLALNPNDPLVISRANAEEEQERERLYKKFGVMQDTEEEKLSQAEAEARKTADEELTRAIKELTDYFKNEAKSGGADENSYIGRLRAQQRELIQQRDSASSEAEAIGYSRQLADINEQLRSVLSGESYQGSAGNRKFQDPVLQTSRGIEQMMGGLQGGDIGSVIMGAGTAGVALKGLSMKAAMKALGWIGLAASAAKGLGDTRKDYEAMADLAALRSPSEGYHGQNASRYLNANIYDTMSYNGIRFTDFGMSRDEFASEAAQRTKQRGIGDDFYSETMRQIGLERQLALDKGALGSAGQYDRYGTNVTDAIGRLVTMLNSIQGSGVDYTDFTRVQEKFDIQQQLMGSYMSRADKPSYDVANQTLAAFSAVKGITQDARVGGEIATFQNAIQNPANDRMRALIFGAVSDIMPETAGRMDLIDRAIRDPKNEGKIMQAVIQRLEAQFGGTDTQMGYFVMKNLFPNISPDRLDEYMKQLSDPKSKAGKILSQGMSEDFKTVGDKNAAVWAKETSQFITGYSEVLKEIGESLKTIAGKLTTTSWQPTGEPPRPRSGNSRN